MTTGRRSTLGALALLLALVLTGCVATSTAPVNPPTTTAVPTVTPQGSAATATPPAASQKAPTDTSGHTIITISDSAFSPATTTVKVGAQAVWQNAGKSMHDIVFDDGSVKSPDISPGAVAAHKYTKAGTFKYHDSHNPLLTGTVIV